MIHQRYPQAIRSHGEHCSICGQEKYIHARVCKRCNPVFSSWSVAMTWAKENASGPCVVIYRTVNAYEQGCRYSEWPAVKGAAA